MNKGLEELERKLLANDFDPSLNYAFEMMKRRVTERELKSVIAFSKIKGKIAEVEGVSIDSYSDYKLKEALIKDLSFPELRFENTTKEWLQNYCEFTIEESENGYYIERRYTENGAYGPHGGERRSITPSERRNYRKFKNKVEKFFEENLKLLNDFFQAYMNDRAFYVLKKFKALEKTANSLKSALADYSKKERINYIKLEGNVVNGTDHGRQAVAFIA